MSTDLQPISLWGLLLGLVLIVVTIMILRWVRLSLTQDLLIGTFRTFAQLILIGFVLESIFRANQWYWVMGLLAVMLLVATFTAKQRLPFPRQPGLLKDIGFSLFLGAGFTIFWVNMVVIHAHPWYHPQYMIPLAGMIIGNSMNSAAIALDRFQHDIVQQKPEIETLLALGATPEKAAKGIIQAAVQAAMIPNINAMMVVGLVSLPGMMTGQILAGQHPLAAITYQIIVMLMITCAASITAVTITKWSLQRSFNAAQQLVTR
jgi:putative ABC transport system permease protein